MARNTSVSLSDRFTGFINGLIKGGQYESASEVIRAGLRLLEEHEARLDQLRAALIEGEESGDAGPLDMKEIKREARRRLKHAA